MLRLFNFFYFWLYKFNFKSIYICTELPDRGAAALLLPVSKEIKTKEENIKLLNGNAGDPTDRVFIDQSHL